MRIKRNDLSGPRIEMLPLIDIVFLLLVFFIYAFISMAVHRGQPVDLPSSSSAALNPQEAISVTIQTAEGGMALFLDEEPVTLSLLSARLRQRADTEQEIQIFADRSIAYQELFDVLDSIRAAGLSRLSLQAVAKDAKP